VSTIEDKWLVWRFNTGDADAFRRIYEKYSNDLLKVAAALLNNGNHIEDVLQDVFVSFAEQVGHFQLNGSLKGYLSICAANRARDKNRQMHRQKNMVLDTAIKTQMSICDPEQKAIRHELREKLNLALEGLPAEQREAIVLHLQGKMRFREIAKLKGVSVNTVLSQYRYGLYKLRSVFDNESDR
jgi:RNA polymerase sigma factor (sigma-70 family)